MRGNWLEFYMVSGGALLRPPTMLPRRPCACALLRGRALHGRALRDRAPFLDEYHTSKLCPGCGKELIDVGKKVDPKTGLQSRLRQCVTVRREKGCCPLFRPNE